MSLVNRLRRVPVACAMFVLLWALASAAPAAAQEYVALGDSYAAGPLIPVQVQPFGCLKSSNNYANLAALQTGYALSDASCSGAETEDMTASQGVFPEPNPPQFDRLRADTDAVTLTIGGNDMGFSGIIDQCVSTSPEGSPCRDYYTRNGGDELSERIAATAPKVAEVLQGITARSPQARVAVVNYAAIFPETGTGCWPQMPVAEGDVPYLREKQKELNAMLATQAQSNGARVVDWYTASIGHDACQPPVIRWVEPMVPVNAAAPVHPNLGGMLGVAPLVADAVAGP
jgi:lysophospholipase L1-like esterase